MAQIMDFPIIPLGINVANQKTKVFENPDFAKVPEEAEHCLAVGM